MQLFLKNKLVQMLKHLLFSLNALVQNEPYFCSFKNYMIVSFSFGDFAKS